MAFGPLAERSLEMFRKLDVPIIGLVENMSIPRTASSTATCCGVVTTTAPLTSTA